MQSCSAPAVRDAPLVCSDERATPYSPYEQRERMSLVGRAKIVLPKYRVRGICRIEYTATGDLLIDFRHSSLFGAYKEDASIIYRNGELSIIDREREHVYDGDSTLSIIGSLLGCAVYPDDLLYALLFAAPACSEISRIDFGGGGGRWSLKGEWRGRIIELEGRSDARPDQFRFCSLDGTGCYIIIYKYDGGTGYLKRIDLVREGNRQERITLEIAGVDDSPGSLRIGDIQSGKSE